MFDLRLSYSPHKNIWKNKLKNNFFIPCNFYEIKPADQGPTWGVCLEYLSLKVSLYSKSVVLNWTSIRTHHPLREPDVVFSFTRNLNYTVQLDGETSVCTVEIPLTWDLTETLRIKWDIRGETNMEDYPNPQLAVLEFVRVAAKHKKKWNGGEILSEMKVVCQL